MKIALHRSRAEAVAAESQRAAFDPPVDLTLQGPVPYDRPWAPVNQLFLSPVTTQRLGNVQEMQSGADVASGVTDSNRSGGDYSREQGVGRAPGWTWPWNFHSGAFNFASLAKWNPERAGLGLKNPHSGINPLVGVAEPAYSPITAMDQYTTFYENDPDQWRAQPTPVQLPDVFPPSYSEVAVLR